MGRIFPSLIKESAVPSPNNVKQLYDSCLHYIDLDHDLNHIDNHDQDETVDDDMLESQLVV